MAGRRDFLKRFGIGIVAAPVAVQAAEAALTVPAKVTPVPEAPKPTDKFAVPSMPEYLRHMRSYPYCVTTTASITFTMPQVHIAPCPVGLHEGKYVVGSEMRELNARARALR